MTFCNVVLTMEKRTRADRAEATLPRPAVAAGLLFLAVAATLTCDGGGTDPVIEPNRPPQSVGVIPPLEVFVGDSVEVEVTGHFRDPDGDSLTHSAMSSGAGVVAVGVAGSAVVVRGISQGAATVTVTATDPGGLSGVQTFAVAVPNRGPEAIGEIGEFEVGVGDSVAIGLPGHFTDPDGDGLVFTASSSDTSVAGVAVARDTVTVAARAKGAATITVTARDAGGLEAQHTFEATVPNRAPVVLEALPDGRLVVGDTTRTDLSLHFSDPDADSLSFAAASSAARVTTATVSGATLTVAALAPDTATITVTATDSDGLAATLDFTVVVPNRAPEALGTIPDTTITVGDTIRLVAARHFRDPDGDSLGFTVRTSRRIRVAATVANSTVTLAALSAGSSNITLTARDPGGLSAIQRLLVVVEPVPVPDLVVDDPMVDPDSVAVGGEFTLSAEVRNQGEGNATSSTTLRFFHSSNPRITPTDSLLGTYRVGPLDPAASSVGALIVHAPTAPGTYHYGACVEALQNESNAANNCSTAVSVRVWQPNRAPQPVGTVRAVLLTAGDAVSLDVAPHFDDPDEDTLAYEASSSAPSIATVSTAAGMVTVSGVAAGRTTITITARDPDGLTATQRFDVTVEPPRFPDLVVETPAADADSIAPGATFTLSGFVRNRGDADALSPATLRFLISEDLDITTADTQVGTFSVAQLVVGATSPASVRVTGPATPGTYYYGACVVPLENESDTGNNCSGGVRVHVWQPNRAPRPVGTIGARPVGAGASISLDVAPHFDDPDEDTLTYMATSSAPAIATASATDSVVTVSGLEPGRATITVTARDPDGLTAAQSFNVTVQAAPSPDLVVQFSASASDIGPGDPFTLNATVRNQGGGGAAATTLRYYRSSDARISIADVSIGTDAVDRLDPARTANQSLSVNAPSTGGTYYYGACVDALADESDRSNNCSDGFSVRVSQGNRDPQAVGIIADRAVIVGGSAAVEVSSNFTDPDGDVLTYSALSSDPLTALATTVNSTVNVTGNRAGSATIVVAAADPDGLTATQAFAVSVEEETTPLPDLVVESPSVDVTDSIEAGGRFTLGASVRNGGPGAAAATTLRYYRSADATITTSDTEVGSDAVSGLGASESSTETITLNAPVAPGTYYLGACVDAVGNESNVANNCSGAAVLRVWRPNRPPQPVGRIANGTVTVGNSISLDVASNFTDPDGDDLRYSVGSSAPDRARATNVGSSVTVAGVAQGSATITVTARDPEGLTATQAFDVAVPLPSQPDLVVQSARASVNTVAPSTSFTLTAVVQNQGTADMPSSTTVRFYRSADATISTSDTEIGNSFVGALAASRSTSLTITATSPATAGTYYYGACVDAVTGESDGTNNCSGSVQVQVQQAGNRAPRAVGTIGDRSVELGEEESIDVSSFFADPDMDQLTYSPSSSKPDTVSVEVNNDEVQFKGQAPGRSTITVTARDTGGLMATQSFRVTVADLPNRAPRVTNGIQDISDAEVGDRYSLRLLAIFSDPDNDALTYTTTNSNSAVASVETRNDSVFVSALAIGSTTMSITATDPGGLSAADSWDVTVVATVPETFDIQLGFTSSVTEAQKEHIRAARDSWESFLAATEFWDVAYNQEVSCLGLTTTVGTVDDHVVLVHVTAIDGISGTLAQAGYCSFRTIGGVPAGPIISAIEFDAADIERVRAAGSLVGLAFHEMAHGLGFSDSYWDGLGLLDTGADPHFTGAFARAAFDAAGGDSYTGNKVPVSSPDHSHWRESVFGHEVMTPTLRVGTAQAVSAITLEAMADIGYTVDVSLADDYDLPNAIAPGPVADAPGQVLDLGNDVVRGPVMVVGPDGRTIRVIPPPPGSLLPSRPRREARIEIRPPRVDLSNPRSLRPPTARDTFWRRDRNPASRPGSP